MSSSRSAEATTAAPTTLARHGLAARVLHALNALAVLILLASGLALADWLGARGTALLGGHTAVDALHQTLGLAFVIAWLLLVALLPSQIGRLLRDVFHFKRADWRWPAAFLRFYFRPGSHAMPAHDGRFDPAQRIVFIGLIVALPVLGTSGAYLYLTPPLGRMALAGVVWLHVASAWLLIACVCLHILAGSGILRTHRGLVTAMFGNGRVTQDMADELWPEWARDQAVSRTGPTLIRPKGAARESAD
ncbi:MAG: cytochrome b/b6 domain-containing protein [Burkholderiaceae bacterium]|nr:MAG: cytochrome b/b6 domain-containing protein [Burkholderiaceae bacterium]